MRVLVTGSSGHLGEALMRVLPGLGHFPVGLDIKPSPFTGIVGSVADPEAVAQAIEGAEGVIHTATLHKPHLATHSRQAFVDTNITGTLTVLEAAAERGIPVVFTSTTSAFGRALEPDADGPGVWIDESVRPVPKNIYGVTKTAAEDLAELMHRKAGLDTVVLRTSRFFPEEDDSPELRRSFSDVNLKANEFLHRRVDIADVVSAHVAALAAAPRIGFGRYIVSATTPFQPGDLSALWSDPGSVVGALFPDQRAVYDRLGFRLPARIGRVYDNAAARRDLGWRPDYDFARILTQLSEGMPIGSPLARTVGIKGYHDRSFSGGPYPVD